MAGAVRVLPAPVWPISRTASGVVVVVVVVVVVPVGCEAGNERAPSSAGTMSRSKMAEDSSAESTYDCGSPKVSIASGSSREGSARLRNCAKLKTLSLMRN
ncbi:hypothetical protein F4818DRAFT_406931 [Hypoxylon cercidicola]|nr:hypothetical protein F4818DRAFT_406931 [Hypoxylon cercidicola]